MKDIKSLLRKNILNLQPYSTARDEFEGEGPDLFLDANESPYENGVNRYPDPHQKVLKKRISEIKGIDTENIFIGNGSDEVIDVLLRIFCRPGLDNVVSMSPSYGMYEVAAATNDIELRKVYLEEDYSLDIDKLLNACDQNSKIIFLCSPNNPTGNSIPTKDILTLCERFEGIVLVDEAYIDFSDKMSLAKYAKENLVVAQTLSKAWGMAGLRIGLAFGDATVINYMSRVKYPYNINVLSQQKALEQLEKVQEHNIQVETIINERTRLYNIFKELAFIQKSYPSDANFILAKVDDAQDLYDYLVAQGVIVRNRNKIALCEGCLRITVGTPQENDRLINTLKAYKS